MNKKILYSFIAFMSILLLGELFARFVIGLGTPPLSIAHPTIEYMFKPDQEVYRFHNRQSYNSFGMRSRQPPFKPEVTIMVFGDSVVNGGNLIDQSELATSLLEAEFNESGISTFVGNVSAGSWGPGNIRAWIEKFGLFDGELLVFVLSSHDFTDVPTFSPLAPQTHPTKRPALAIVEGVRRYLPNYLPIFSFLEPKIHSSPYLEEYELSNNKHSAGEELKKIIQITESRPICLVQHRTWSEIEIGLHSNHYEIQKVFFDAGAHIVQLHEYIKPITPMSSAYRDDIHLTPIGQKALLSALKKCIQYSNLNSSSDVSSVEYAQGNLQPD